MIEVIRLGEFAPKRIHRKDIIEEQNLLNANTCDGNDETWFDDEILVSHVTVIDEDEFFNRYFGENYDE